MREKKSIQEEAEKESSSEMGRSDQRDRRGRKGAISKVGGSGQWCHGKHRRWQLAGYRLLWHCSPSEVVERFFF